MELEELVDKYRAAKPQVRYGLVAIIGLIPAVNMWLNEGETLEERKANVESEYSVEREKFEAAKQKAAELPALLTRISEIESELNKAKQILPDRIEMDSVLATLGNLEKEMGVKLMKFTPNPEMPGEGGLEYKELPVDITMQGSFSNIMRFMDRMVHLPNLTHMRNIQFTATELNEEAKQDNAGEARKLESTARLILFKGL